MNASVSPIKVFLIFLKLGLTSFGGPVAHIGYFRQEFVERRKWLDEHAYADLVALCQFLPGPASSQVGIALGLSRSGIPGAIAAWLGFTLPSAILLVLFGLGLSVAGANLGSGWLHGLKIATAAVVAQAIVSMWKNLSPDKTRTAITVCAAAMVALIPSSLGQVGAIITAGIFGCVYLRTSTVLPHAVLQTATSKAIGMLMLFIFALLLLMLPVLASGSNSHAVELFERFYRAGALVFGGGHVVLPLLQSQVVPAGWVSNEIFLAGYGVAQAVPGPLFTFAAYLGAVSTQEPSGWLGAGIALIAIFLPSFLLIIGILPFWEQLRRHGGIQRAMLGINAAVVGILLAAFYNPVLTSAIQGVTDFCLAVVAFSSLVFWKAPPWLVVLLAAVIAGLTGIK